MTQRTSLLGLGDAILPEQADELISTLAETWTLTVGTAPADLESDLVACRRWFDPVAQGQRLRRELSELRDLPEDLDDPGDPLTLSVGPKKRLVTPEGRCALELLRRLPQGRSRHVLNDAVVGPYERRLGELYRDWSRHRLRSVVDLLAGADKPLQIPAAAAAIALLVNRCTEERRAFVRFSGGSAREVVDRAFFQAVHEFSDVLAPARKGQRDQNLVSGWMLYEARRRLGDALVVVDARGGMDGKVWVRPGSEDHVTTVVARDLARGHRVRATPERFGTAYDALVEALRRELPTLAGYGLAHERPANTRRLRQVLVDKLASHVDEPGG